jgi:biotin carboxyl carrier protein
MADLTERAVMTQGDEGGGDGDGRPGARVDGRATDPVSRAAAADPRAVRVRLAPASRRGDEPPVLVSPLPNATAGPAVAVPSRDDGHAGLGAVVAQRQVLVDGRLVPAELRSIGRERHLLQGPAGRTLVVLEPERAGVGGVRRREVLVDGFRFEVEVEPERTARLRERASRGRASAAHGGPQEIRAIIPGKVVSVLVAAGEAVTAGQQLLVVEAMKMQNELRSPREGTVERVGVAPGVNIEIGDLLVVID